MFKRIFVTMVRIIIFIALFSICVYIFTQRRMKYMENHGFTKYDLTENEIIVLNSLSIYVETGNEKYSDGYYLGHYIYDTRKLFYKLYAYDGYTDKKVDKFNEMLFGLPQGDTALRLAEEYGFSKANPITVDWILEHPKKTCQLLMLIDYDGSADYMYY